MNEKTKKAAELAAHADRCESDVLNEDWTSYSAFLRGASWHASRSAKEVETMEIGRLRATIDELKEYKWKYEELCK